MNIKYLIKKQYYRVHLYNRIKCIINTGRHSDLHKKFLISDKTNITVHRLKLISR